MRSGETVKRNKEIYGQWNTIEVRLILIQSLWESHARAQRRFPRGLKRQPLALIKKLRKVKQEVPANEKPKPVRTHLDNMIIFPENIRRNIGVYNQKTFNQVEIKPKMIGHYLAEFSISYKRKERGETKNIHTMEHLYSSICIS